MNNTRALLRLAGWIGSPRFIHFCPSAAAAICVTLQNTVHIYTYYPQRFEISPRLRRQLSAVINFVRFKEGKEHLYLDAMAKKQRLAAGIAAAQVRGQREGQPANTQTSQTERTIYCNRIAGLRYNMSCGLCTTAESRSS